MSDAGLLLLLESGGASNKMATSRQKRHTKETTPSSSTSPCWRGWNGDVVAAVQELSGTDDPGTDRRMSGRAGYLL